jgi:hypothetical protein
MAWKKSIKLQKLSAPKLLKVLFADRGNPSTIRRLVFTSWRSFVHSERTKELLPMSDVWHKKADALEIKLTKESSIKKQRKKELKELIRDLSVSNNHVKNKKRQIDLLGGKLIRLDNKMEPVKKTLLLFAQAAVDIWNVYTETLIELIQVSQYKRKLPMHWLNVTHIGENGMGLGLHSQTKRERLLFTKDINTFVPVMYNDGNEKKMSKKASKKEKHTKASPITNYLISTWNRGTEETNTAKTLIQNLNQKLANVFDEEKEEKKEEEKKDSNSATKNCYTTSAQEGLLFHFGTREEAMQQLLPIYERSKKSSRSKQLSTAGLMHYYIDDSKTKPALSNDETNVLLQEITKEKEIIRHATTRSIELDQNVIAGEYKQDVSGLSRGQLANDAISQWKKASEIHFLRGGTLTTVLNNNMKINGGLNFGAHVQGWHMLSRHCHTVKERQRKREAARNQGKNVNVLSLAVAMYGSFNRTRLTKIVEADMQLKEKNSKVPIDALDLLREVDALAALTLEFAPEIRGWYIRYSGVNGMGSHEFYLFTKQIKILSRTFRLVDIDLVRVASGAGDGDGFLDPPEFVEALIRLSLKRYSSATADKGIVNEAFFSDSEEDGSDEDGDGDNETSTGTEKSKRAVDRVRRLLLENVGKYAHQVDIDSFRARFADPDVQVILVKKRRWLLGKFREYCAADGTQAATSDQAMYTMNLTEWDKFLRDHNVFDIRFKNRSSATIFVCAQAPHAMDEMGSLESALEDNQELIYQEFLEAVVALAHFRFPDPFVPLSTRVGQLLDDLDEAKPLNRYFASNRFGNVHEKV